MADHPTFTIYNLRLTEIKPGTRDVIASFMFWSRQQKYIKTRDTVLTDVDYNLIWLDHDQIHYMDKLIKQAHLEFDQGKSAQYVCELLNIGCRNLVPTALRGQEKEGEEA